MCSLASNRERNIGPAEIILGSVVRVKVLPWPVPRCNGNSVQKERKTIDKLM